MPQHMGFPLLARLVVCSLLVAMCQAQSSNSVKISTPKTDTPIFAAAFAKGPVNAPVTIVEFTDFECPFCGKVEPVLRSLVRAYPEKLRIIFKNNPLPIHPHAGLAHEAALAAGEQGKFWEMEALIFGDQARLSEDDFVQYAKQLGLDVEAFRGALMSHRYRPVIDTDLAEAKGLGVSATPTFFINGRKMIGAQSLEAFKAFVDQALGIASPVAAAQTADGSAESHHEFSVGQAPSLGPAQAPVTVVEFADFQCPFCSRVVPTVYQLLQDYPDRIRFVFKNFPLDFHADATLAAQAALAAKEQGKFWEMHDRIFANQRAIKRDNLIQMARDLGLDVNRFVADMDSGRFKSVFEADNAEAARLGVTGTPTFFINGRELGGAAPLAQFKGLVDAELRTTATVPQPAAKQGESVASSETKGPSNAPVNILWYADLESPFSIKANDLMRQIMQAYPDKVRLVFKNRPLEFHHEALLAHEAALAAGAQGKFWEMLDLILTNQNALQKEHLLEYASRLKLDRQKFAAALDSGTFRAGVNEDLAQARALKVSGVPVFFVNGKRVDGMQPFSVFQGLIEAELKQAPVGTR